MIKNRVRSSECELGPRHCPAAVAHARLGTPREKSSAMMVGKCVHAIIEAVVAAAGIPPADSADAAALAIVATGMSFEGNPPEFPTLEEALEGRELALRMLDKHLLPLMEWSQAELEVNLSPIGWDITEADKDGQWPPHWHQLIDIAYKVTDEDAYGEPIEVAGGVDWKGWDGNAKFFERLQGKGYAVCLATLFPSADVIRRGCGNYQLRGMWWDEIDLRTEEGQDRLEDYRRDLDLAIKGQLAQPLDVEALAMPGAGCAAGYDGVCPYFTRCKPAMELASFMTATDLSVSTIGEAAQAFALGEALSKAARKVLKGYGGGPVPTSSGHLVGWKDTTSATGSVDPNAALWLAREYATFVLNRPDDAEKVQGLIRATGVGRKGAGVTVVNNLAAMIVNAGMDEDEGKELLARCLGPKPGKKLAIWKQPPPEVDLLDQLRQSIEAAEKTEETP